MTKCKITINSNKSFVYQSDAKEYLKKLVDAGILFIKSCANGDKTLISVDETNYYQTIADAKRDLKKFVDAGILYLEVERDHR